jgi:hypothetical protein
LQRAKLSAASLDRQHRRLFPACLFVSALMPTDRNWFALEGDDLFVEK